MDGAETHGSAPTVIDQVGTQVQETPQTLKPRRLELSSTGNRSRGRGSASASGAQDTRNSGVGGMRQQASRRAATPTGARSSAAKSTVNARWVSSMEPRTSTFRLGAGTGNSGATTLSYVTTLSGFVGRVHGCDIQSRSIRFRLPPPSSVSLPDCLRTGVKLVVVLLEWRSVELRGLRLNGDPGSQTLT